VQTPVKARPIDKAEPRFSYGQVEQALADVFSLGPEARKGKLRARLIHLRRSGLPSYGPGKGRAISYTQHQVDQWAVALALENANVDPKNVVKIIREDWGFIAKQIAKAREENRKKPSIKPMMSCWSSGADSLRIKSRAPSVPMPWGPFEKRMASNILLTISPTTASKRLYQI
jgi:hypothetical protein